LYEFDLGLGVLFMDQRDKLILSLSALLKAERETRFAFETAISNGVVDKEILQAIVSDPVPMITQEDINFAEDFSRNNRPLLRAN
jgi:hypothetical protein